jgi:galactokinase
LSDRRDAPTFAELFGRPPTVSAEAPGRVNLIGEHTDYNGGFVLPIATRQTTTIAFSPRRDGSVRLWSAAVAAAEGRMEYLLGAETRTGRWVDYVAGVTSVLRESGAAIGGFDARIESDVPLGGGLSSSASLEVAVLRVLNAAFDLALDPVAIARLAHRAETGLVGAPVGIMDPMAVSLADERAALFLDTQDLTFERLPLPPGTALIVIHSGITHRHATGGYRQRREECEAAARLLGVPLLRAVNDEAAIATLPPPLDRRARHVFTENVRVLNAREALRHGDAHAFGVLMSASHRSMRDDFEVSTPEIDQLVAFADAEPAVLGARLTGGGFGGCIVALADAGGAPAAATHIAAAYRQRVGLSPSVLMP